MFTPNLGEDESILTSIFFNWVAPPPTRNICCSFDSDFFSLDSLTPIWIFSRYNGTTTWIQKWRLAQELPKMKSRNFKLQVHPPKTKILNPKIGGL